MIKCKICQTAHNGEFYKVPEMMFGLNESFDYFQCAVCQCLQICKVPPDLKKYYPDGYYSFNSDKVSTGGRQLISKIRDRLYFRDPFFLGALLRLWLPHGDMNSLIWLRPKASSRILDVGCGNGQILKRLRIAGFNKLLGVDPFIKNDIAMDNRILIKKKEIFSVQGEWDVVMFHHSFEHMGNQRAILKKVFSLLARKGTCLIRMPTVSSAAWKQYGNHWVQLDAPRHFYLHSLESIKRLALDCGLKLARVVYDSIGFQFWGSEQYKKGIPLNHPESHARNRKSSLFTKREIAQFSKKAKSLNRLNLGDQAAFYFSKRP